VVSASTTTKSPTKGAKGKGKAAGSDVDPEDDEEGRVAPSRRLEEARQELYKKSSKFRERVQAEEAERELEALFAEVSDESDAGTETATGPAREVASTAPAPDKGGQAASRTTKTATIQNGNITRVAKAKKQPEKPKRKHRKVGYAYESVPDDSDDSDDGQKQRDTVAKLRETIERHAR
jgi:hypothetical protein